MPLSPDEIRRAQQAIADARSETNSFSRQKWEYLRMLVTYSGFHIDKVEINGRQELGLKKWDVLQIYMDGLGLDGWELVSQSETDHDEILYFKRPIA